MSGFGSSSNFLWHDGPTRRAVLCISSCLLFCSSGWCRNPITSKLATNETLLAQLYWILLPPGDSSMIFPGNFPLDLVLDMHSSHAGKYNIPGLKLHVQIDSWGSVFEAVLPSSPVVRNLMSCVIKWHYTVTLCWWRTWPVGKEKLSFPIVLISPVLTNSGLHCWQGVDLAL